VRSNRGFGKFLSFAFSLAVLGLLFVEPIWAARGETLLRTPRKSWQKLADTEAQRITLVNTSRAAAIDMRVNDSLPDDTDVQRLVQQLTGQDSYKVRGRWPQKILDQTNVQMGVSITLSDGRKGFYAAIWRKRPDGMFGITGYMTIATEYSDENIADFKLVRSLGNQLARGSALFARNEPEIAAPIPEPVAGPVPVIAQAPPVLMPPTSAPDSPVIPETVPAIATADSIGSSPAAIPPAPAVVAPTAELPAASPTIDLAQTVAAVSATVQTAGPVSVPTAPVAVPVVATVSASAYPFIAAAGAGVQLGQIATLLYAPLESSEVFVLFKDGSFHENLPVALEQWNFSASRAQDPDSWGKWKPAEDAGDYEMKYAEDDIVTISAMRIKPPKTGLQLQGSYGIMRENGDISSEISFVGNKFEMTIKNITIAGTYRIEGYSVILIHANGQVEHKPFFILPAEEADEEPAIWLGDRRYERIN
jgi:hypothetical protein